MKWLKKFEHWTTDSTFGNFDFDNQMQYVSNSKIYYGIHEIYLRRDGKGVKVKAKFDTGARTSSIDFSVAKKLGISDRLIEKCKELENVHVPKNITKSEQKELERSLSKELKNEFPEVTSVQASKSSSGFSVRAYIKVDIEYSGQIISTEVNLRDRSGLTCEMLVGLRDML